MEKFYKTYSIKFDIGTLDFSREKAIEINETIYVNYPLTAEFAIGRSISAGSNSAIVKLYNLDETKRRLLYKDAVDTRTYIKMYIYAGYGMNNVQIYQGTINECYSVREGGEPDYITVIDSYDVLMEMYYNKTSQSFDVITDQPTRIERLAGTLFDLQLGKISPNIKFPFAMRGTNDTGTPIKMMRDLGIDKDGNETMSVDLGQINFLDSQKDIVDSFGILEIDCDTGLLGSPRRRNNYITANLIFEPAARLNQQAVLTSTTVPWLNQAYKIMAVSHNGVISGSKDSAMTSTIDLYCGFGEWTHV